MRITRDEKSMSVLELLELDQKIITNDLNKKSEIHGALRRFCIETLIDMNKHFNDPEKNDAKFRIECLGTKGLHVYVQNVWKPITTERLVSILTNYFLVWNGTGDYLYDTSTFRSELEKLALIKLKFYEDEDLWNFNDIHKAVFIDRTFFVKEQRIEPTKYTTYHTTLIPFELNDIGNNLIIDNNTLEIELEKLGRIGKVIGDRFLHRPDLRNFCEHNCLGFCAIKSSANVVLIIQGTPSDGKSTLMNLLKKILPEIYGGFRIVKRYSNDNKTRGQDLFESRNKKIAVEDDAPKDLIDASIFKPDTRQTRTSAEVKYVNSDIVENRQILIILTNTNVNFTEYEQQIQNRILILQSEPNKEIAENLIGDYEDTFSEDEKNALLKFILRVGFGQLFQGKLTLSENTRASNRFRERKTDHLTDFIEECKISPVKGTEKPEVDFDCFVIALKNFVKDNDRSGKIPSDKTIKDKLRNFFKAFDAVAKKEDKRIQVKYSKSKSTIRTYLKLKIENAEAFESYYYQTIKNEVIANGEKRIVEDQITLNINE